ncbi:MAG: hypothetical protein AB4290_01290 [Spirulina sp.]
MSHHHSLNPTPNHETITLEELRTFQKTLLDDDTLAPEQRNSAQTLYDRLATIIQEAEDILAKGRESYGYTI